MYVRRNRASLTPPVNYAGVAFSKDQPTNNIHDKDTKIHKAHRVPAADVIAPFKEKEQEKTEDILEGEIQKYDDISPAQEPADAEPAVSGTHDIPNETVKESEKTEEIKKEEPKGILSDLLDGKFSIEDILLFASLFLLVSGQIDDEILLLAGVLLLLNH